MRGQLITMGVGMSVVPVREDWFFLRMVGRVRMGRIKGVVLFQFTVPILIWAGLKPGLGGLGIIRLAIRSASWRHSQYFHSLLLKRSQYGSGITECRSISSDPSQILEALFLYILRGRFTDDLRGENRMVNTETFLCQVCREPKKQDEVVT
jgi:uncharacterized membrane protein